MKIIKKTYGGFTRIPENCACAYCHQTPLDTEIQEAYASGTYICGDIDCWNAYCWEWVWTGKVVEIEEHENARLIVSYCKDLIQLKKKGEIKCH